MNEMNELEKATLWSCYALENIMTTNNEFLSICSGIKFKKRPKLKIDFQDYDATVEQFLYLRQSVLEALNNDVFVEIDTCRGCPELARQPVFNKYKISALHIQDFNVCNLKCIYCVRGTKDNNKTNRPILDYRLLVEVLKRRCLIDDNLLVNIALDEISIIPGCDEIASVFKNYTCCVFTNALFFRDSIKQILQGNNRSYIITSVDAGTRETFAKVKGHDVFGTIRESLINYSDRGVNCVKLKYIILPNINDNYEDANGFLKLCDDVCAKAIILSRNHIFDIIQNENLPDNSIQILAYIWQKAQKASYTVELLRKYFSTDELNRLDVAISQSE